MLQIRRWRNRRGFTLKELQDRTGIPFQMLSLYERGEADPPTGRIMLIAEALDVPIGQLFPRKRPAVTGFPYIDTSRGNLEIANTTVGMEDDTHVS